MTSADDATGTDDAVFKALADPTRRALLDALFAADGQSVQALDDRVPGMTRFGVMKHLAVLEAANLVVARRRGRQKLHYLNPVPITEIADRWISKYAQPFARALADPTWMQRYFHGTAPEQPFAAGGRTEPPSSAMDGRLSKG